MDFNVNAQLFALVPLYLYTYYYTSGGFELWISLR